MSFAMKRDVGTVSQACRIGDLEQGGHKIGVQIPPKGTSMHEARKEMFHGSRGQVQGHGNTQEEGQSHPC